MNLKVKDFKVVETKWSEQDKFFIVTLRNKKQIVKRYFPYKPSIGSFPAIYL